MKEENSGISFFGYEIKKKLDKRNDIKEDDIPQIFPEEGDEADIINVGAGHYGQYYDIDGGSTDNISDSELIYRYRGVAEHTEVDMAINEIVDEAVSTMETGPQLDIVLDNLPYNDTIKTHIENEFRELLRQLDFSNRGSDLFRQWYVDGKMYVHIGIDRAKPEDGIKQLTVLDPTCVRKIKEVSEETDRITNLVVRKTVNTYYVYTPNDENTAVFGNKQEVKLPEESVICVKSGLMDIKKKRIQSYLHKALKPINQLRMMEDALVIYRLARAPERRIFYIDTGNLPRGKAEEYVRNIMSRYKNKIVYDASTGEIKDQKKHMSMLEDYWLPRQEGGRGTEIDTLPGGDNLGQIEDIIYFKEQVYKSLNIPVTRIESDNQFTSGRATEISRDEVKFQKFINRLRRKFSHLFIGLLETQLQLKSIVHKSDWEDIFNDIQFDYNQDNHFFELKEFEILQDRLNILRDMENVTGKYVSHEWVQKNVLKFSDNEIAAMQAKIKEEKDTGLYAAESGF
jgi:hypothetical protein